MKNAVFWNVACIALVRTDVSEECIACVIKGTRIGDLGAMFSSQRASVVSYS
jgi:hypothetical protein